MYKRPVQQNRTIESMKTLLMLVSVFTAILAEYRSYVGYKVFEVHPKDEKQLNVLHKFNDSRIYDFWVAPKSFETPTIVKVAPSHGDHLIQTLKKANIDFSILINDVQNSRSVIQERNFLRTGHALSYHTIEDYLFTFAEKYPEIVSVEDIGTSYENRTIRMIKLGYDTFSNPIILINGGIHGREWISAAFATYLIDTLFTKYRHMLRDVNWYIIPVLNPDGYEYTKTDDRYWRKTRSGNNDECKGVDIDRNFDYHWMEVGASSDECSDQYAGPSAFSEPETAALRDVVNQYKEQIKLYLSFHSYGNNLLYPWGFTDALPDNVDELHSLATSVEKAITAVSGTKYIIGSSANVLYAAAGSSVDWVKGVGGVPLAYKIELPGGGNNGYDMPSAEILHVCRETFKGIQVFYSFIKQNFADSGCHYSSEIPHFS